MIELSWWQHHKFRGKVREIIEGVKRLIKRTNTNLNFQWQFNEFVPTFCLALSSIFHHLWGFWQKVFKYSLPASLITRALFVLQMENFNCQSKDSFQASPHNVYKILAYSWKHSHNVCCIGLDKWEDLISSKYFVSDIFYSR